MFTKELREKKKKKKKNLCTPSDFICVQFFAPLWTVALQAPLSMGFSRQEYWSGLSCPLPGDRPEPRTEPQFLMSTALAGGFLPLTPPGKPLYTYLQFFWLPSCPISVKMSEPFLSMRNGLTWHILVNNLLFSSKIAL